jgi:hypothetical protein
MFTGYDTARNVGAPVPPAFSTFIKLNQQIAQHIRHSIAGAGNDTRILSAAMAANQQN